MTDPALDLTSCDREPIHIPGAVQPHGLLLVLDGNGRLAGQAGELRPGDAEPSAEALEALIGQMPAEAIPDSGTFYLGCFEGCDVTAHRSGGLLLVEFEQASDDLAPAAALAQAQKFASSLEAAHDIDAACAEAARAVRDLTGYDRIMIYRFLADGSGAVIAEEREPSEPSLLNHHFPASDIPKQARQLYLRNLVRVIPNVGYEAAPLILTQGGGAEPPLDMSDCVLRSVSPVHIQYLKNMGVAASASISIVVGGELWGLIACHHRSPRPIGYLRRELAKHFGQLLGQQVAGRERAEAQVETVRLGQKREELLSTLVGVGGVEDGLMRHVAGVIRTIPSDGVAVCRGGEVALAGSTPDEDAVRALLPLLRERGGVFVTSNLAAHHPDAEAYAGPASGLLACAVPGDPPLAILWFRAEEVETVNWAGNPHKPADGEAGALSPRKSFELWRETVRGRSRRWSLAQIEAADRLRDDLQDVLAREQLVGLNQQLRRTLSQKEELLSHKDLLMREVNHRVQNSLQLVNSMLYLQERDADSPEVRAQFELARQRLTAVAMVHRRLWRTDKIGDIRLNSFLSELAEELVKIWGPAWEPHIHVDSASLSLSTDRGIILGLILTELLTNAVKYAYAGQPGPLRVEAREDGRGELRVTVTDRGVGMKAAGGGTSFGSRLIEALTRQLGGRIEVKDNNPGTRAALIFPLVEKGRS
ncbi:MAG TPA: histidine kinase dimerization/phosphoacceptor domain -containing protein [Allosphingosinicella sp.]|jgi:light-regulated signal transduction histidine kinase (bacteriophytochrome)